MAESKYVGRWRDWDGMQSDWRGDPWDFRSSSAPVEGMATDDEVIFAAYGGDSYEGLAIVVYERDGQLYKVNASHCSCYGLEGQWKPEETTWAALGIRKLDEDGFDASVLAQWERIKAEHAVA